MLYLFGVWLVLAIVLDGVSRRVPETISCIFMRSFKVLRSYLSLVSLFNFGEDMS